jgi:hypothetical protein
MPPGLEMTVPFPDVATDSVNCGSVKTAVSVVGDPMPKVHGPVLPEHWPPLQPANCDPAAGVAVRVIEAPVAKLATQLEPQSMPAGDDVTVPVPVPAVATVSAAVDGGARENSAVTVVAALIVTTHAPVPLQPPPLHPVNTEPLLDAAESETVVPAL